MVGGASVGENDYTGRALEDIGEVIFHGTNISPGKVSGLVKVRDKPVFLVPGHILSAVSCVYNFVYKFIIEKFFDGNETLPRVIAKLAEEPTTRPGRYIFRPVTLRWMENTLYAYPHERRMGGSTLLSSLTGGNGFIVISPDYTPKKGDYIVVRLYSHYELI
jgi:molybdopterin molybdotransferase